MPNNNNDNSTKRNAYFDIPIRYGKLEGIIVHCIVSDYLQSQNN